jgi:hypothetical protein
MADKRKLGGAAALFLAGSLLAAAGCEENVTYGYFQIDVKVMDPIPREFLDRIAVCGVAVLDANGNQIGEDSLKCPKCSVTTTKLGTLDWSTNRKGGDVSFLVTVNDLANDPNKILGKGMSGKLTVMPNGVQKGTVEIVPEANWMEVGATSGPCP